MTLYYENEKWTMITLATVAISLTIGLVLMQYAHSQPEATLKDGSFNIDVKLSKDKSGFGDWFQFPDKYQFDLSNSSMICPSNDCKSILSVRVENKPAFAMLSLNENINTMTVVMDFRLVDDQSNGHFTPKKQNLVEQMSFDWACSFSDIQEDTKKKTTKYICSNPEYENIIRKFNSTSYPYEINFASFELPSMHLVLNATEVHEQ
jgi:hypothetical protein